MKQDRPGDRIIIFDTTLRDGEQSPYYSMKPGEKLAVAKQLVRLGVDIIEAGFPISSMGDFQSVKQVAEEIDGPVISALARAAEIDITRAAEALAPAIALGKGRIHTFIATSQIHLENKLRKSEDEVVAMAQEAVALAKTFTPDVEFSCEDAGRSNTGYLIRVVRAAIEAGATTINLPDTTGYCVPEQYRETFAHVIETLGPLAAGVVFSTHCHNDLGMAVANSLAAIQGGARQVECTVNGIGERAGNCSLEELVMHLATRADYYGCHTGIVAQELGRTSKLVTMMTGRRVQHNKAVVGANAFAHEAGIHQDGVIKNPLTYEIMSPASVGWKGESIVIGKHSGRRGVIHRLAELGFTNLPEDEVERIYHSIMELCDKKKTVYDDDLIAIASEGHLADKPNLFFLKSFVAATDGERNTATVWLRQNGEELVASATGNGPIDAAIHAVIRASNIDAVQEDYSSEAIGEGSGAQAHVSVVVRALGRTAHGRAADANSVKSAVKAFLNGLNRIMARTMVHR